MITVVLRKGLSCVHTYMAMMVVMIVEEVGLMTVVRRLWPYC